MNAAIKMGFLLMSAQAMYAMDGEKKNESMANLVSSSYAADTSCPQDVKISPRIKAVKASPNLDRLEREGEGAILRPTRAESGELAGSRSNSSRSRARSMSQLGRMTAENNLTPVLLARKISDQQQISPMQEQVPQSDEMSVDSSISEKQE